ncbi:MAG: sigma 54-interacting transcriptional regulator, partial [Myxococcales bacterium]
LLRAIQERRVKQVGGNKDAEVDVRIIAATNRDLAAEVKEGRFREDLYYRLNVIQIRVPPLRDRREDIPALAQSFIARHAADLGRPGMTLSREALALLTAYDWPGNVRELENATERAVTLAESELIGADVLPPQVRGVTPVPQGELELPPSGFDLQAYLDAVEQKFLQLALERAGGVKKEAAKLLGLTFRSMRYRLAKQGLSSGDPRVEGDEG